MEIPDPFVVLQILMETLNETIDVRDEGNSFFKNPWRVWNLSQYACCRRKSIDSSFHFLLSIIIYRYFSIDFSIDTNMFEYVRHEYMQIR